MDPDEALIRRFYQAFNERSLADAASLFHPDAVIQDVAFGRDQRGPQGLLAFTTMWLEAFPDASLVADRITWRDGGVYEVEASAEGTHLGSLDMGGCGVFKPSGTRATLSLRHLLEIRDGQFVFSSLSFDIQDIVRQLVTVDFPKLHEHLQRIHQLAGKLAGTPEDDLVERRMLVDRLGRELDAARHIIRPYFTR
jgi:predicted ester cyclase